MSVDISKTNSFVVAEPNAAVISKMDSFVIAEPKEVVISKINCYVIIDTLSSPPVTDRRRAAFF